MIVLDASVILKWFLPEEGQELALGFLENHSNNQEQIAVPELLYYEITNTLSVKTRLSQEAIVEAMSYLFDLSLAVFSLSQHEYIESMSLSRLYNVSVYDASYVALAKSLGTSFITADKRLVQKLTGISFVKILGE